MRRPHRLGGHARERIDEIDRLEPRPPLRPEALQGLGDGPDGEELVAAGQCPTPFTGSPSGPDAGGSRVTLSTGPIATCPSPQIDVSRSVSSSPSSCSRTSSSPRPCSIISSSMACALCEPTRHGTHLPHDSLRKKRSTLVPAASRSVPSATATRAPEPSIEPFSASGSKSSGTSSASGPRKFDEAPPGWNARSSAPPAIPPASSISSRAVVPIGTQ